MLICGIPNAGKTTYSERFCNVIHYDEIREYGRCAELASKTDGDVVVEGIFIKASQRRHLIKVCKDKSPKVCIWIDTPLEECKRREDNYRKRPLHMVESYCESFEPPTLDEGWDEIIHLHFNTSNEFPTP